MPRRRAILEQRYRPTPVRTANCHVHSHLRPYCGHLYQWRAEDAIREAQEAELGDMPPVTILPIPNLPSPPQLEDDQLGLDMKGSDNNNDKTTHPLYPPQNGEFMKHFDPNFFQLSRGRYLGLSSNWLSDPLKVPEEDLEIFKENLEELENAMVAVAETYREVAMTACAAIEEIKNEQEETKIGYYVETSLDLTQSEVKQFRILSDAIKVDILYFRNKRWIKNLKHRCL